MHPIRLITFDALHTIITPRLPIYAQYSQVFAPYVGDLEPEAIKTSFKVALKSVQAEYPSYCKGAQNWWGEVIRCTALNAGADQSLLYAGLPHIVQELMKRFSSKEGYCAFADAIPTIKRLKEIGIRTAVVSNGDSRIRAVLKDLDFPSYLQPIVLSEEEGIEKPSAEIFLHTLRRVNAEVNLGFESNAPNRIQPTQCLHVGDELKCDFQGARGAAFNALLLRRPGPEGQHEHREEDELLDGVQVIHSLNDIVDMVSQDAE